jgi:hypothetical protein
MIESRRLSFPVPPGPGWRLALFHSPPVDIGANLAQPVVNNKCFAADRSREALGVWEVEVIVKLVEAAEPKAGKRGPYQKWA